MTHLRREEMAQAVRHSGQRHPPEEEDDEDDIRESGRDVNDLRSEKNKITYLSPAVIQLARKKVRLYELL